MVMKRDEVRVPHYHHIILIEDEASMCISRMIRSDQLHASHLIGIDHFPLNETMAIQFTTHSSIRSQLQRQK